MRKLRTNGFIWITRAGGVICTAASTSGGWGTDAEEVSDVNQRRPPYLSIRPCLDTEAKNIATALVIIV